MPVSYRGPLESEKRSQSRSQSAEGAEGADNAKVARILAEKGSDVFSVSPETPMVEVIKQLAERKIGALMVVQGDEPVGIVSERDVVRHLVGGGFEFFTSPVKTYMTSKLVTSTPDDTIEDVMRKMTDGRFRHMPVVKRGKLAGMISIGDVVRFRLQDLEYENLRIRQAMVG